MDYKAFLDLLTSKEFYLVLAAFLGALKGLAELLEKIGRQRKGRYWENDLRGRILWSVCEVGKIVNFIAPGNKKEQPGLVARFLQVFKK